jgi:hypothetical protein
MSNRGLCVYIGNFQSNSPFRRRKPVYVGIYPIFWSAEAESTRFSGLFIGSNPTYVAEMNERNPYPVQNPI